MSKDLVVKTIEERKVSYFKIAKKLWEEPELSYEERKSSALQKKYLKAAGFRVTELDDIQNYAFVAEYGSGKPVIGLLGEFDALPGLSQKVTGVQDPAVPERRRPRLRAQPPRHRLPRSRGRREGSDNQSRP